MKIFIFLGIIFFTQSLYCIEEKDWMHEWPAKELQGTEQLIPVDLNQIDQYALAVTYALDGGRFGDQLVNYIKTLWISWRYKVPLMYRPFDYSDQLMLSTFHSLVWNDATLNQFSKKLMLAARNIDQSSRFFSQLEKLQNRSALTTKDSLLCVVSVLTPLCEEWEDEKWENEEFKKLLKQLVQPKNEIILPSLPKDAITVAIHIRTGIGYDWQLNIDNMPTKFPPDSFYLNGLKYISQHFSKQQLHVHIFTDDPQPVVIRDRLQSQLPNWDINNVIKMECRLGQNQHDQNVLLDFFTMTQFDCLIRPDSYFSRCVAALGAPIIEVKPIAWGEYRKDKAGNPIKDTHGHLIIDCQCIIRDEINKTIIKRQISPIDSDQIS
jgi:hypothetical protein